MKIIEILKFLFLTLVISISFLLILTSDNANVHIIAFWFVVITNIFLNKLDINNPNVWFTASFALYSTGYAILQANDYVYLHGYTKENILYPFIALIIFIVVMRQKEVIIKKNFRDERIAHKKVLEYCMFTLLIILLFTNLYIYITPFNHKNDLAGQNFIFSIAVYSSRVLCVFSSLYLLKFSGKDKKTSVLILSSLILITILSLLTGDRDAMLRYIVVLIVTLFIMEKISRKMIILMIPIGTVFLIGTVYIKYYFVNGALKEDLANRDFIHNFLNSDFSAAGSNFQLLLNNSWTEGYFGFKLIFNDIIQGIVPFVSKGNVGVWFNDTFHYNSYSRAFTLVGEGYVVGGIYGVIILFLLLSFIIRYLYKSSVKNAYWMSMYIYSIPTIILTFRSSLGVAFREMFRISLLSLGLLLLLYLIISKKTLNKNQIREIK